LSDWRSLEKDAGSQNEGKKRQKGRWRILEKAAQRQNKKKLEDEEELQRHRGVLGPLGGAVDDWSKVMLERGNK